MTLKQLEAFYWAATCANFALAAERLDLSTSSLSKRISELEQSLEVQLFDRSAHRAALTEAGAELLGRAAALLKHVDETRLSIGGAISLSGTCALGVGELSALTWLPRLATCLRDTIPALRLQPHVDIGTVLQAKLLEGALDCAVVAGRPSHHDIASHPIGQAKFVWVAAPGLSRATKVVDGALLREHPLVTLPPGAGTTRLLDDWLLAIDADPPQRFTCNSWGAIAGMLMEGFGVGILPEGWARAFRRRKQLRILENAVPLAPLTYTFQHRRLDRRRVIATLDAAVRRTVDFAGAPKLL